MVLGVPRTAFAADKMPGYLGHWHALGQPQDFWIEIQVSLRPAIGAVDLQQLPFTDQVTDGHRLGAERLRLAPALGLLPLQLDEFGKTCDQSS
jgi:hypothetical protein